MARTRKTQSGAKQMPVPTTAAPAALLDVMGAARWLGISRRRLFQLMREEKDFPVIRLSDKMRRFDPNSLYQWSLKRQNPVR